MKEASQTLHLYEILAQTKLIELRKLSGVMVQYLDRVVDHTLCPFVKTVWLRLVCFNVCKFYLKKMEFKNLSRRWGEDEVRDKASMANVDDC